MFFCCLLFVFNFKTKSKIQERQLSSDAELFAWSSEVYVLLFFYSNNISQKLLSYKKKRILTTDFIQILKTPRKSKIQTDQLICYADFSFMIILCSYPVKSHYFNMILHLLRLLSCTSIIIVRFTIQLLSIVPEKRERKRRAKHHCTRITLRIEETSTLRVTTPSKLSTLFMCA